MKATVCIYVRKVVASPPTDDWVAASGYAMDLMRPLMQLHVRLSKAVEAWLPSCCVGLCSWGMLFAGMPLDTTAHAWSHWPVKRLLFDKTVNGSSNVISYNTSCD